MNNLALKTHKTRTIVHRLLAGIIFGLSMIHSDVSSAYIPELPFILKKSASTTGKKIMQIEQEVIFRLGDEEARVDEVWLIEGDRNLKMLATGKNLYKESIKLNYLYNGKNKTYYSGKNRIVTTVTSDFYPRFLFIRSKDSFATYLKELNIPSTLRLSRANGVISFLIGQASEQNLNPHVWIGQEDFVIRKIRTPSAAEVSLDQITLFPKDVHIARSQTVTWAQGANGENLTTVQIRIKKVDLKASGSIQSFYPQTITFPSEMTFSNKTPLTATIEEFYTRFR